MRSRRKTKHLHDDLPDIYHERCPRSTRFVADESVAADWGVRDIQRIVRPQRNVVTKTIYPRQDIVTLSHLDSNHTFEP